MADINGTPYSSNALPLKGAASRFTAMFFAFVLACSLVSSSAFAEGASAQGGAAPSTSAQGDAIAIVFTNDVHCSIDEKTSDGVKTNAGYVGITTPETLTKSSPINFQDESGNYVYGFCQDETGAAFYASVQASVNAAREDGADYVVAIGHLGESGVTDRWTSEAVIANTTGIDAMIDGHSHETYSQVVQNGQGEDVVLAQAGTKLVNVGELVIDPDAGDGKDISVAITPAAQVEAGAGETAEAVKSAVAKVNEDLNAELNTVVGESQVDLKSEDAATGLYVRWQETNLGDFVADAYRARLGADVGLANGGGVRASLSAGEITNGNLLAVQPFGNELCLVEVTGQTLLDALEMGVRKLPDYSGGFLQVSGIKFSVNVSIPSSVVTDENGNFVSVEGQRRVSNVMVGDEALDLEKTYTVASHAYMLLQGGDGMVMFKDGKVLLESVMLDNQALIEYVTKDLDGEIGQEYANPEGQGRIVITEEPSDPDDGGGSGEGDAGDGSGDAAADGSSSNDTGEPSGTSNQASTLPKTNDTVSDAANAAAAMTLFAALASAVAAVRIARKTRRS